MNIKYNQEQQDSPTKAKCTRPQQSRAELWLRRIGKALETDQMVKYK